MTDHAALCVICHLLCFSHHPCHSVSVDISIWCLCVCVCVCARARICVHVRACTNNVFLSFIYESLLDSENCSSWPQISNLPFLCKTAGEKNPALLAQFLEHSVVNKVWYCRQCA